MPEIRQLVLEDHTGTGLFRLPGWGPLASKIKLALRRLVVLSATTPLRFFYRYIYRLHVRYAVHALKQLPGMRAIYVARGIASGDILYGVSDVDLVVLGDWSDSEHAQAMAALRRLSALSPLYDASLWQHAHAVSALRNLYATDFYYEFRFDQGRTQWKLLWGEDIIASLPPVPQNRLAGGYYMDIRNWWDTFTQSALGNGVTARDAIFRHSTAYKTVGEIVNKALALDDGFIEHARKKGIDKTLARSSGLDRDFLLRLKRSAERRHLGFEGDIQQETFSFLLRTLERVHRKLPATEAFAPLPAGVSIDAPPQEVFRSEEATRRASAAVDRARTWSGYRGAYLVPSISFFALDDLMLLIEVDPEDLPTLPQLRELRRSHTAYRTPPRQRVALSLLLPNGAYQLETVSYLELWHLVVCPAANPDTFSLLSTPGFALDGAPRAAAAAPPVWTRFAAALIDEEITVRRAAMSHPDTAAEAVSSLSSLDLIRQLWRHLQLEIVERSTQAGHTLVPLTPEAIERALHTADLPPIPQLDKLREVYRAELEGKPGDPRPLLAELMGLFAGPHRQPASPPVL